MFFSLAWVAMIVASSGLLAADDHAGDPIQGKFFPPELLMHHRAEIGLTDEQIQKIRSRAEEAGPKAHKHQLRLKAAMGKLAELLAAEKINEQAALKQLDAVLAIEKEVKQTHFRVMIQIRNELTAQQRKIATKLRHSSPNRKGLERRLKGKIARIKKEVRSRVQAGNPPHDVARAMQKFPMLMKKGQVREAEALLDRVIKALGLKDASKPTTKPKPQGAQSNRTRPARDVKTLSLDALQREVDDLKKEGVAWRKIAWKTCLLDGLKASREQKKPIMLWVFIDRPIDDERC